MTDPQPFLENLIALLNDLGVPTLAGPTELPEGFPMTVSLADGSELVLDLPTPGALSGLDPDHVGVAIVGPTGRVSRMWGLAARVPAFQRRESCLVSDLGPLLAAAYEGTPGSMYLDGMRYHATSLRLGLSVCVFVLVTNALEEREARRNETRSARAATALTRIGKTLTMDPRVAPLCVSAAHEIASATELASVLLWVREDASDTLVLRANVGANSHAARALQHLSATGGTACLAELVAASQQPFHLASALDHLMSIELEAKICYLPVGGVSLHPLVIGNRLVGVLELIGREGDSQFLENLPLFQTIAEHLSLALNSALMFEGLEKRATHDALTGIANHRTMQEFLQLRLAEAKRTDTALGVIMFDVDHFRNFNEEEGHDAGDRVLCMVAEAISGAVRPYDLPARYGGEEFAAILPGADQATTLTIAERIRRAVGDLAFESATGRVRHVSGSLGCSGYPHTATDAAGLLKAADTALYEAKRTGRDRVCHYEGEYVAPAKPQDMDIDRLIRCVPHLEQEAARAMLAELEVLLQTLARQLRLSDRQHQLMRGLACLAKPYAGAMEAQDAGALKMLKSAEEFRLLQPALDGLRERFDGKGPKKMPGQKIPLLARVMAVAFALREDPASLTGDPGRFDPEVVAAALSIDEAA